MKKYLIILVTLLLSYSNSTTVQAEDRAEFSVGKFSFRVLNEQAATVELTGNECGVSSNNGLIIIPGTVSHDNKEYSVVRIGENGMAGCLADTITIPQSVTSIGRRAFSNCNVLDLRFEDEEAELDLEPLSFTGLEIINGGLKIPTGTKILPDSCFFANKIVHIDIPATVTEIGERCFTAGEYPYTGYLYVRCLTPPSVAASAFEDSDIPEIYVPSESVGAYLDDPVWNGDNLWSIKGGFPVRCDGLYYLLNDDDMTASVVKIPESVIKLSNYYIVNSIPPYIFVNNTTYTVNRLAEGAMSLSRMQHNLTLPPTITEIGKWAFSYADFTEVVYEDSDLPLTFMNEALANSHATRVSIPDRVDYLPDGLIKDCEYLGQAVLPESLSRIGDDVFSGCTAMYALTVKAAVPPTATDQSFDPSNFSGCTLYVPDEAIQDYAEAGGWKNFEKIISISSGVRTPGYESVNICGEVIGTDGTVLRRIENPKGISAEGCCDTLPSGIYIIRLTDSAGQTTVRKMIR